MVFLTSLLPIVVVAIAGASAFPAPANFTEARNLTARQAITTTTSGTNGGFYFAFFTAGTSDVIYTNLAGGEYEVQWDGNGDFVAGKGWNPGFTNNVITFSGSYGPNPSSDSLLSVYGWSINPLVEYYINEDNNDFSTAGATHKGTVESDGSLYDIYEDTRVNEPSIQGTATFNQYLSIRQSKRTSGTVTVQNHVNAWAALGMNLGTMNEQIVAVEGLDSSGQATITVSGTGN